MDIVEEQRSIRILIADDEPHFRHGLRAALESTADHFQVVAEAKDGHEALDLARLLHPDVILLDVHMPGTDGIAAARAISGFLPETRILMLTVSDSPEDVAGASKAGAAGYLLKERSLDEVAAAVVALAKGQPWPEVAAL